MNQDKETCDLTPRKVRERTLLDCGGVYHIQFSILGTWVKIGVHPAVQGLIPSVL